MNPTKLCLTCLPLLAILGCADGPVSDGPAAPIPEQLGPPLTVAFTSTELRDACRIGTITRYADAGGTMHLSVPIRNAAQGDFTIDYRFSYFDAAHAVVDQPASWQTQTLHAGTFEYLDAVAPSPRAATFELAVRPAQ